MRVYTAVYTAAYGRVGPGRVRAVYRDAGRVHGSCAVCYYDFLCKRHFLCRNVQLQIHYIQKELGQLALLAPRHVAEDNSITYNAHNRVNGELSHLSFFLLTMVPKLS